MRGRRTCSWTPTSLSSSYFELVNYVTYDDADELAELVEHQVLRLVFSFFNLLGHNIRYNFFSECLSNLTRPFPNTNLL